ncbi:uncharacterized protein LOC62_05G007185 [Vanrija pseudolonga]|uniref:SMP domain-containing protein n=1 Tax=Vanrija pseudolonga TaxID=143232 RepID=A0AAF0YBJ4_9TREE|nr:hypothetical protein LOC62_05G007185 [Vanrija pseudolonga]
MTPPPQHRSHARHPSTMTDAERAAYTASEMSAAASLVDVPDENTAGVAGQVAPGMGAANLSASQVMAPVAFNAPSSAGLAPAGQAK